MRMREYAFSATVAGRSAQCGTAQRMLCNARGAALVMRRSAKTVKAAPCSCAGGTLNISLFCIASAMAGSNIPIIERKRLER
mmetsp:Transcript_400/g.995  ORF Transcript_400/g.995 Transcript_400/m.995 type:complete len:82 (-) Transcript_400:898-1143(-)